MRLPTKYIQIFALLLTVLIATPCSIKKMYADFAGVETTHNNGTGCAKQYQAFVTAALYKLEKQLHDTNFEKGDIEDLMSRGLNSLISLGSAYENATLVEARELIGLIYPENFTFCASTF